MRTHTMRKLVLLVAALVMIGVAGCSSTSKQLVGVWKGDIVPPTAATTTETSHNLGESFGNAMKGFIGGLLGPLTIEFNADGKYKVSISVASETGTYSVSGDEVTLTPDNKDENRKSKLNVGKLILSGDGKSLHTKKEFQSDTELVLKKQE
jgi:hypothetical protein